jgi:hypothetical protein
VISSTFQRAVKITQILGRRSRRGRRRGERSLRYVRRRHSLQDGHQAHGEMLQQGLYIPSTILAMHYKGCY